MFFGRSFTQSTSVFMGA